MHHLEGAEISHFLRTRPCVLNVRYMLRQQFEICMMIFLLRARAGRLAFVDLFFTYIDLTSHACLGDVCCVRTVYLHSIFKVSSEYSPRKTL